LQNSALGQRRGKIAVSKCGIFTLFGLRLHAIVLSIRGANQTPPGAGRTNQETSMSKNDAKPVGKEGELTDKQLDGIAGGQEVKKMGTIVVTAKREQPANDQVVKMEKITVTAKRDKDAATQVASADTSHKKN
jgi:hypothetical protein